MNQLITPHEADQILASIQPLSSQARPFMDCLGLTLREDLRADRPFPPFDRITMDGIACRQADLALGPLKIQGLHCAGDPKTPSLKPAHCWKVMTGSSFPPDCDLVIPVEELSISQDLVTVLNAPSPGSFIHRKGSDSAEGDLVLPAGKVLNAAHLGLAATIGKTELEVTKTPRITILTTGDELVPIDQSPLPHQLRRSNGPTLLAALAAYPQVTWHHLPDLLEDTRAAIKSALSSSDLLLLSGGISKGDKDFVRPALEDLVGPPSFHGILQRPGKPLAFWRSTNSTPPIFALPGNPNSTLLTFHRYVKPALTSLAGNPPLSPTALPLSSPLQPHPKLTLFLPAQLLSNGTLKVLTPQNSGDFAPILSAHGFIEAPPGQEPVKKSGFRFL